MFAVPAQHAQHAVQTVQQIAQSKADWDDKLWHYGLFAGGMFLMSIVKVGFDWVAKRFWKKVDHDIEDIKAFKAWQKAGAPKA